MKKQLQINIPNPCSESWDAMLPAERGKFCNVCEKVVTDFTGMTDKEIIRFFEQHKQEHVCGRYFKSQVDREIKYDTQVLSWLGKWPLKRIAALFLFTETMATNAFAQKTKPAHHITTAARKKHTAPAHPNEIRGYILDELTKAPIRGVSVRIMNTDLVATTDVHGRFKMILTDEMIYENALLHFTAFYSDSSENNACFVFLDKRIDADSLLKERNITIYRYPVDTLPTITTRRYAITKEPPIIMGGLGGEPPREIIIKKIHWYDPKYWFRRRHY